MCICLACSRRRNPTPTDVAPPPQPSPSRCSSGSSLRSLAVATEREDSPATPTHQADDGDGDGGGGGDAGSINCDVELLVLPEPTHRGYGSLQKIYPHWMTQDVDRLRLFDRAVDIFLECVPATRDHARMNSQTFRNFVRSVCHFLVAHI